MEDTIGTQLAVLYREVSLIQTVVHSSTYVVETADSVLIRKVSLFGVSFIKRFHCATTARLAVPPPLCVLSYVRHSLSASSLLPCCSTASKPDNDPLL